ncbi:MAG: bifunctional sugar-1-phosphate nucleotidylyltransferase/acetyltransferase [Candidatus Nanoarchaeia archaeon]|jgi:bifunctional UDP-N-acetylglucosamine pyrophosphorylase/glucosamine-1-phosphate N-acetyltransferase
MKAVILAAGEGSRLWPISENVPKPLVKILGKYFLEYQIIELSRIGIKDVIIVKGKNFNDLFESFKNEMSEKYGVIITYMVQEQSLGTGDAFFTVKNIIDEPFIGLMGDNHYQASDIEKLINVFKNTNKSVIGGFPVANPENYGVIMTNDKKMVTQIVEKPKSPTSNLINAAIYIFKPEIFKLISTLKPQENGEIYITDAINILIKKDDLVCEQIETWYDLGKPYQILPLTKFFFKNYKRFNAMSKYTELMNGVLVARDVMIGPNVEFYPENGLIIVEENSKILGSTVITGNNYIGPDCEIINSIIRETTVLIGENTVKNSEIKNSTLGFKTKAPHFNYIGDSYIGENCNFGAGAKIANLRNDNKSIKMFIEKKGQLIDTGLRKLGIFTGNNVNFGINSMIAQPGILIGSNVKILPGEKIFRNKVTN